jgi:hypothetical protein
LAITGTPVQNNLKELWTIYNWVMRGELLGGYTQFKERYELPITNARKKDASDVQKKRGTLLAEDLRKMYAPFFLRRTKTEVMSKRSSLTGSSGLQPLPPKFDWVVWITLTEDQIAMYRQYLQSRGVRHAMIDKSNALTKLVDLKKICDSPYLLSTNVIKELDKMHRRRPKDMDASRFEALLDDEYEDELVSIDTLEVEMLMSNTAKLIFLIQLLENLRQNRHRTLVFSQSTRMLDIIQKVLRERNFRLARLDGKVKNKDRDKIVTTFQESETIDVCLLSTGVGSVGLTLTNADRVVIYDPSWNPGSDAQAIDRAYRIGQTKPVIVYRLITCATVEEKIFIRQVFKNSVIKQMVQSEQDPTRYFNSGDIRELLKFDDPFACKTHKQIEEMHGHQKIPCPLTDSHRSEVTQLPHCFNVSDHDLLFSVTNEEIVLDNDEEEQVITNVRQTREKLDSEIGGIRLNQEGRHVRPFELRVPEGGQRFRYHSFDDSENPTEIDPSISVESVDESQLFDGETVQVNESDLMAIPPLHPKPVREDDDEAVDFDNLSDDNDTAPIPTDDSDSETDVSENADKHDCSSPRAASLDQRRKSGISSHSADTVAMADRTADKTSNDSEIVGNGRRRLRVIDSDSEASDENGTANFDGNDVDSPPESPILFQNGSGIRDPSAERPAKASNSTDIANETTDADVLSDDESHTSSEFLNEFTSPANFKSIPSAMHSTAVNFDPMDSPGTPARRPPTATSVSGKSAYFTPAPAHRNDMTVILSDNDSDEGERSSPILGQSYSPQHDQLSDPQLSQHLSRLSIPKFDRTNHALDQFQKKGDLIADSPPHSDGSSSPIIGSFSRRDYPIDESPYDYSLNHTRMDMSGNSLHDSLRQTTESVSPGIRLVESPLPDDRPDSPLIGADVSSAALQSLMSAESPARDTSSIANASHVTLRKRRTKSRLGNGHVSPFACALDFNGADDVLQQED